MLRIRILLVITIYASLLGINCVADVVRHGRLRWFGHLERKSVEDLGVCLQKVGGPEGTRGRGRM